MYRPPPSMGSMESKENDCVNGTSKSALGAPQMGAVTAQKRPPLQTLSQPFKVPFKESNRQNARRKTRKTVDYRLMFESDGATEEKPSLFSGKKSLEFNNFGNLFQPFKIPSKNLQFSDRVGTLGLQKPREWVAKPLYDPYGEFAIVLFDPSVDKLPEQMIEEENKNEEKLEEVKPQTPHTPQAPKSSRRSAAKEDQDVNQKQEERPSQEIPDSDDEYDPSGSYEDNKTENKPPSKSVIPNTSIASIPEPATTPVTRKYKLKGASVSEMMGLNKPKDTGPKLVPVVIDPKLARILRPHQIEGTKFLYRCTMGFTDPRANGCIMADEMGLGKTLQCIALLWTMLKQSPAPTPTRRGTIEKAVVICPSSLVNNWANEFTKWLGDGAVNALAVDGKSVKSHELSRKLQEWARAEGRRVTHPVLVISYETLRRNATDLGEAEIGLLLADEGHRLKNGDSLTFSSLNKLNVKRRVILSGTPIQNDLSEYFSLLNFANPNYLGTRADFRKNYENKILAGRDADATEDEVLRGEEKLRELLALVNKFIIRRTNDILSKYLPVKYEHVVFCGLSDFQRQVYNSYLKSKIVNNLLKSNDGMGTQSLKGINVLKKICNHPDLLDLLEEVPNVEACLPEDWVPNDQRAIGRNRTGSVRPWYSGKFMVLMRMLTRIHADTNDKIVIISNYTQTLDMVETMCRENRFGNIRLDGTMAINKRQKLVDRFNDAEQPEFVFLLSSKAGGCGINLIGANRLILLDPDWNPAADQQALARVWRDGQKKDCFVYRFIATGTIEEKILQRQSMKQSLSSCVVDEKEGVERLFSADMLKSLFKYNGDKTLCDTHDTFKCKRCSPERQLTKADAMLYGDATTWNHYPRGQLLKVSDKLMQQESDEGVVDFVFQYISH